MVAKEKVDVYNGEVIDEDLIVSDSCVQSIIKSEQPKEITMEHEPHTENRAKGWKLLKELKRRGRGDELVEEELACETSRVVVDISKEEPLEKYTFKMRAPRRVCKIRNE